MLSSIHHLTAEYKPRTGTNVLVYTVCIFVYQIVHVYVQVVLSEKYIILIKLIKSLLIWRLAGNTLK